MSQSGNAARAALSLLSVGSVKRAIEILRDEGLVVTKIGRGIVVSPR